MKGMFYKTLMSSAMILGFECWALSKIEEIEMNVAK